MENTSTKKNTPKISEYGSYPESPYTVELQGKYVQADPDHKRMQGDDGKLYGMYEVPFGRTIPVDISKYSKLFKGNTSALMSMSEPAAKMFYYITENLKVNSDQICILRQDYLKFAGYKTVGSLTYYRALDGLMKANVIAKMAGSTTCYWVNPNILFNGDRTKLKNIIVRPPQKPFSFGKTQEDDI